MSIMGRRLSKTMSTDASPLSNRSPGDQWRARRQDCGLSTGCSIENTMSLARAVVANRENFVEHRVASKLRLGSASRPEQQSLSSERWDPTQK